jgi:hypothetical protein
MSLTPGPFMLIILHPRRENPELASVEIIDTQASPELADRYAAHSVPQAFTNEQPIAGGAQPEELFMSFSEQFGEQRIFVPENDAEEVAAYLVNPYWKQARLAGMG